MYAVNWMYGTRMTVLDIWTWSRGVVPNLGFTDGNVDLLSRVNCDILTQCLIRFDRILISLRYIYF
jgi:hypothetical protein